MSVLDKFGVQDVPDTFKNFILGRTVIIDGDDACYSCNKCAGRNTVYHDPFNPESSGETETKCKNCGHEDYWSYGFFMSGQGGLNASSKY